MKSKGTRLVDADIVALARKLDRANSRIVALVKGIQESGHPNADKIMKYIVNELNVPVPAFFPIEIHHLLEHPEKWERNERDTDLVRKRSNNRGTHRNKE